MSFTSLSSTEPYDLEDMPPKRVCIRKRELIKRGYKNFQEWKDDPSHLYIGRNVDFYVKGATASVWHNPYKLESNLPEHLNRCLDAYRKYILLRTDLMANIHTILDYKEIGCWCENGEKCHGDILIELASGNIA